MTIRDTPLPRPTRVLLVDDHALFRDGLTSLFAYEADFEVVGQAVSAPEAVRLAERLRPDLVLMDIELGEPDGIDATRMIAELVPEATVVMLTVHDGGDQVVEAVKAGAQGYLLKSISAVEMLDQLRGLGRGEAAISRRVAARLLEEFRREAVPSAPDTDLTAREQEVLKLVAQRHSNKEIASLLVLSEHTVKNHLKSILAKLHVRSRRHAATYALARGWFHPDRGRRASEIARK